MLLATTFTHAIINCAVNVTEAFGINRATPNIINNQLKGNYIIPTRLGRLFILGRQNVVSM